MKYLNTKHEKNSAKITMLIVLILLLLFFVIRPSYQNPLEEYGIAVNFDNNNSGSGNGALSNPRKADIPRKSEPQKSEQQPQVQNSQPKTENVLTQNSEEAIAIKKKKDIAENLKVAAAETERLKKEAEEKRKNEEAEKRKKLDNLIGGVKNSEGKDENGEGNDENPGNKGQLKESPYAPSYFDGFGPRKDGVGFGLSGRGKPSKKIYKQNCNEYGLVVLRIEVNQKGEVVNATPVVKKSTNLVHV